MRGADTFMKYILFLTVARPYQWSCLETSVSAPTFIKKRSFVRLLAF
jgi:hypothetical protein